MEYHVYGLLKSSYFELFRDEKYGIFLRQKVDGKMIFIDYWKVLVLSFSLMGNTVFFFSENVDGKRIFTWSFWAFHGIPGLGKYGFSCSVSNFTQYWKSNQGFCFFNIKIVNNINSHLKPNLSHYEPTELNSHIKVVH